MPFPHGEKKSHCGEFRRENRSLEYQAEKYPAVLQQEPVTKQRG
jgi:hypothetical protein